MVSRNSVTLGLTKVLPGNELVVDPVIHPSVLVHKRKAGSVEPGKKHWDKWNQPNRVWRRA